MPTFKNIPHFIGYLPFMYEIKNEEHFMFGSFFLALL